MPTRCPFAHQPVQKAVEERLKRSNRFARYTTQELQQHNHKESAWIAVEGKVFDITHHVLTHKGWTSGCAVSTLMATLRVLGTDCTEEVLQVHSSKALRQLQPYMIGELVQEQGNKAPLCGGHSQQQCAERKG